MSVQITLPDLSPRDKLELVCALAAYGEADTHSKTPPPEVPELTPELVKFMASTAGRKMANRWSYAFPVTIRQIRDCQGNTEALAANPDLDIRSSRALEVFYLNIRLAYEQRG